MLLNVALMCLALNVYHEARGASIEAQFNTAQVVMNRVASDDFPDTVCEVVEQPAQFSWFWDGIPDDIVRIKPWERAKIIASIMLIGDPFIDIVTHGALYYHALDIDPGWMDLREVHRDDAHVFYKRVFE